MPESTVASLPAAASNTGKVYVTTDSSAASTCSTGGGGFEVICRSDGSSWVAIGDGASGASGVSVEEADSSVVASLSVLDFDGGDFNITESPSGEANISLAGGSGGGCTWTKYTKTDTDLTDADTSQDVTMFTATQYEKIRAITVKHSTAF